MRPIIATLHRKNKPIWTRHYSRIDSAIPRLTFHMLMDGEPGDVMALSHAVTGLEIGTVKLSVGNKLKTTWIWD